MLAGLALAAPAALAAPRSVPPIATTSFTLGNGLQFIVHEDHSTPIVAVVVYYDVGAAHDPPGRRGFAHLFEHLLFQETEHMKRGYLKRLVEGSGGFYNGATVDDSTLYLEVLPSNRLNLALWIEAERMARLRVTDENVQREREVVNEEDRMRRANQPYGKSHETLSTLATDYPPYDRVSTMADLDAATAADVYDFYKQYYNPNSATVIISGNTTEAQVRTFAEQYFAGLPRGPDVAPLPPPTPTPRTSGERRATLTDGLAVVPRLDVAYNIPPRRHGDTNALWLLSTLLGEGESSRLHRRLVAQASSLFDSKLGPGLLIFRVSPMQGIALTRLERLIEAEVRKLQSGDLAPHELEKAKNQLRAERVITDRMIDGRQTVLSKALWLQDAHLMYGDADAANTTLDKLLAVTAEDITRVARTYLVPANRTVVATVPGKPATGEK
ncbi:MAG: M16 family metallopeptidase [Steroidobacteraceae bacterium]